MSGLFLVSRDPRESTQCLSGLGSIGLYEDYFERNASGLWAAEEMNEQEVCIINQCQLVCGTAQ